MSNQAPGDRPVGAYASSVQAYSHDEFMHPADTSHGTETRRDVVIKRLTLGGNPEAHRDRQRRMREGEQPASPWDNWLDREHSRTVRAKFGDRRAQRAIAAQHRLMHPQTDQTVNGAHSNRSGPVDPQEHNDRVSSENVTGGVMAYGYRPLTRGQGLSEKKRSIRRQHDNRPTERAALGTVTSDDMRELRLTRDEFTAFIAAYGIALNRSMYIDDHGVKRWRFDDRDRLALLKVMLTETPVGSNVTVALFTSREVSYIRKRTPKQLLTQLQGRLTPVPA